MMTKYSEMDFLTELVCNCISAQKCDRVTVILYVQKVGVTDTLTVLLAPVANKSPDLLEATHEMLSLLLNISLVELQKHASSDNSLVLDTEAAMVVYLVHNTLTIWLCTTCDIT